MAVFWRRSWAISLKTRFWAWVGAIPHWIYITRLRATGRQPWTDTVLWLSGIGIAMTLTGIIVGIRAMVQTRRRSSNAGARGLTPYVKPLFRWHHLFGLCFGLFVLTWIFRLIGKSAEGVSYAIIFMNCLTPMIEQFTRPLAFGIVREKKKEEKMLNSQVN